MNPLTYSTIFALLILAFVICLLVDRASNEDKKNREWLKSLINKRK